MRIYYEAIENVGFGEIADRVKADITEKLDADTGEMRPFTEAEIEEVKIRIQDVMAGLDYRLTKHLCNHDTGGSCISEEI